MAIQAMAVCNSGASGGSRVAITVAEGLSTPSLPCDTIDFMWWEAQRGGLLGRDVALAFAVKSPLSPDGINHRAAATSVNLAGL